MVKRAPQEDKTYILTLASGDTRKITIPSTWKMTFGQLVPYDGRRDRGGQLPVALRFYEGSKDNLRAVMTDVVAFRDASIQVMEKRTSVKRQIVQKATAQGNKNVEVEARMTEWVNPDAEADDQEAPNEFLTLPANT